MGATTLNQEIKSTSNKVRDLSFKSKKDFASEQELIDRFLDAIPRFKMVLVDRTNTVEEIVNRLDQLTWHGRPSDNALLKINDLIAILNDWHSILAREYAGYNFIRKKGIAKEELKNYKFAIDDIKEAYEDLESVFFFLPEMPQVKETTKALSLL